MVFRFWKQFSIDNILPVILYFGVKGHGKRLVDGMSSFCVKEPVRRAIVSNDWWYVCASELVDFLSSKFLNDVNKYWITLNSGNNVQLI